jgi:hypothetical protein
MRTRKVKTESVVVFPDALDEALATLQGILESADVHRFEVTYTQGPSRSWYTVTMNNDYLKPAVMAVTERLSDSIAKAISMLRSR